MTATFTGELTKDQASGRADVFVVYRQLLGELVDAQADGVATTSEQRSALQGAASDVLMALGPERVKERLLCEAGTEADRNRDIRQALRSGDMQLITALLEADCRLIANVRDLDGRANDPGAAKPSSDAKQALVDGRAEREIVIKELDAKIKRLDDAARAAHSRHQLSRDADNQAMRLRSQFAHLFCDDR